MGLLTNESCERVCAVARGCVVLGSSGTTGIPTGLAYRGLPLLCLISKDCLCNTLEGEAFKVSNPCSANSSEVYDSAVPDSNLSSC